MNNLININNTHETSNAGVRRLENSSAKGSFERLVTLERKWVSEIKLMDVFINKINSLISSKQKLA